MVSKAAMQMPRSSSDSFSLLPSAFQALAFMFVLASMMELVCRNNPCRTMARPWVAQE